MTFSWGHDEYMASVLERNGAAVPPEAVYLVRYHSFYPWHTPPRGHARGYAAFAGERDWQLLPLPVSVSVHRAFCLRQLCCCYS